METKPETREVGFEDRITVRVLEALRRFKEMGPWSGNIEQRKMKFQWLHDRFNEIFGRRVSLHFEVPNDIKLWYFSGSSYYSPLTDSIHLKGRLSVITFMHEWGHAIGLGQREAQEWAVGLFKTVFPEKMANLTWYHGCLVKKRVQNGS